MQEEIQEIGNKKTNSRKFFVWILWSLLIIALVVIGFIRNNDEIIIKTIEYYFFISVAYIGGNCVSKGINAYKEKNSE